mgnify:FL=1
MSAHSLKMHSTQTKHRAFTLIEIMVVVVIIGLLAAITIPAFQQIRLRSQVSSFANDLRIAGNAFETFATENGTWPSDGISAIPNSMNGYLSLSKFNAPTPLGGVWDWDYQQFDVTAGLSVRSPAADIATMTKVDESIDDGDLTTGSFLARSGGYILVLEN